MFSVDMDTGSAFYILVLLFNLTEIYDAKQEVKLKIREHCSILPLIMLCMYVSFGFCCKVSNCVVII